MSDDTNTNQEETGSNDAVIGTAGTDRDPSKETGQPTWFWTNDLKGEGEKPDFLLDKYTTVADQAKAYTEAQKRLGAFTGAPKDGYNLDFVGDAIDRESPTFNKMVETAKNLNISQDALQTLLGLYVEDMNARAPDREAEMAKLGPNAQEQINVLGQWAKNNLSDDEVKTFNSMITTADSAKLFMKMRELTKEQPIPTSGNVANNNTVESWQREMTENYQEYVKRGEYYNKMQAKLAEILPKDDG